MCSLPKGSMNSSHGKEGWRRQLVGKRSNEAGERVLWSFWSEMKWTIIAGEGVRYRGQGCRVWSWVTPSVHVLQRGVVALLLGSWLDEALKTTQMFKISPMPFSSSISLLLCASECFCQILLSFLVGEEKRGIIIHITYPVSDSFAVAAVAWQQLKRIQALETVVMFPTKTVGIVKKIPRCSTQWIFWSC